MDNVPTTHHLDRRADSIAANVTGDDDDLLTTAQVAQLLGVSLQWMESARRAGYGPECTRLSQRTIRYRRDVLREWLRSRTLYRCTKEYGDHVGS
jgi:hypothetical protein